MLDWSYMQRLSGRKAERAILDIEGWEGSFEEYLLLFTQVPAVARSAAGRLRDLLAEVGQECVALLEGMTGVASLRPEPASVPGPLGVVLASPEARVAARITSFVQERWRAYASSPRGALFALRWRFEDGVEPPSGVEPGPHDCPWGEEPIRLIPEDARRRLVSEVIEAQEATPLLALGGPLCPFCRQIEGRLLRRHQGDWARMISHVRVVRREAPEGAGPWVREDWDLEGAVARGMVVLAGEDADGAAGGVARDGEGLLETLGSVLGKLVGPDVPPAKRDVVLLCPLTADARAVALPESLRDRVAVVPVSAPASG